VSDEDQIKDTIQTYFDCMYESSAEKARARSTGRSSWRGRSPISRAKSRSASRT